MAFLEMDGNTFLKKHLQEYKEKKDYCTGKYVGSINQFVESFMAVSNDVYRKASVHHRGKSKRLKVDNDNGTSAKSFWFKHENSLVPIPFCGQMFEIIASESWICSTEITMKKCEAKSKRKGSLLTGSKCSAVIQVRTVKLFTDFLLQSNGKSEQRKDQEKLKLLLSEKIANGEEVDSKIIHYCRFPLESAHTCQRQSTFATNRLERRVAKKIREFAQNGIYDVDQVQTMLCDFVKNTLFAHLDANELPSPENNRYFPTKRVIYKHLISAIGPLKQLKMKTHPGEPLVMSYLQHKKFQNKEFDPGGVGFIAVHGGAGFHSDEKWPGYQRLCDEACWSAMTCLKEGGTSGEAVTIAVKVLEDSELTNAGLGSNLTESGHIECDASMMDCSIAPDCRPLFGAVTGVSSIKNPIMAARQLIVQQTTEERLSLGRIPPCVMSGDGAEKWARAHKVEMCEKKHLISDGSLRTWRKYQRRMLEEITSSRSGETDVSVGRLDTVGAVAIDTFGNVSSAASSGGLLMKLPGRIGQAAMYGCGCWAEKGRGSTPTVAVATTGCGEQLMYTNAAMRCASNLQRTEEPYTALQETIVNDILNSPLLNSDDEKQVGLLAFQQTSDEDNSTMELVWGHTTRSMLIGYMSTKDHKPEVLVSRLPDDATPGKSLSVSGTWVKVASHKSTSSTGEPITNLSSVDPPPHVKSHRVPHFPHPLDGADDRISMDDDISLLYISTDVDGLPVNKCAVKLSDEYNRKVDEEFEKLIDTRWQERLKKNPRLYNGSKFRIDSVGEAGETLEFRLGLTCYKDYMETNWSPDVALLRNKGETIHSNSQAYLADPLGVAGIVVTSDEQVIFQRRSHWVAEGAGKLDVPGGHPEPSAITEAESDLLHRLKSDDVMEEIFKSQLKEIRDELNIPLESLSSPLLMGLIRNNRSAGRPVCYFIIRCSLSTNQIEAFYGVGGAEADESLQLVFKPLKELVYMERESPGFWAELCPNGKAAVTLYSILEQVKQGNSPFQLR